jgi:hypothetical protein
MKETSLDIKCVVRNQNDADYLMSHIRQMAGHTCDHLASNGGDPLEFMKQMKFDPIGYHPVDGHRLNLVEQINQTWTFVAAVSAARLLLRLHPDAGGFRLAPGENDSLRLDVMSEVEGLVGAETCAVVHPRSNRKLERDLTKLAQQPEIYRYAFFMCPLFPGTVRRPEFERDGIQVWSVDI